VSAIRYLLLIVGLVLIFIGIFHNVYGVIGAGIGFVVSLDVLLEDIHKKVRNKLLKDIALVCLWVGNMLMWLSVLWY